MALRPVVIVGCGGSGGKVVQMLRAGLQAWLRRLDWEGPFPEAWQLLVVDSPVSQEVSVPGVGPVSQEDYFPLSQRLTDYNEVITSISDRVTGDFHHRLDGWLPQAPIPVTLEVGAGRMRAVGRAMTASKYRQLGDRLGRSVDEARQGTASLNVLAQRLGVSQVATDATPATFVVSSLAGGTGAGVFIDVCDLLRAKVQDLNMGLTAILFTAEVFRDLRNNDGLQPNSLAALSELMAGYYDQDREIEPLYKAYGLPVGTAQLGSSGPSQTYVVGMSPMEGPKLDNVMDCYRAVSETLLTSITDSEVSDRFTQYSKANWLENQRNMKLAWNFGNLDELKGVVSSFGSAKLSVGLDRFEDYAAARLARTVIEFQRNDWADTWRRRMAGEGTDSQHLNHDDIVDFVKKTQGLAFVESCQLNEVDVDHRANDQIQESITSQAAIRERWTSWRADVLEEDLSILQQMPSADWMRSIEQVVPAREGRFLRDVESVLEDGLRAFVVQAPELLLKASSTSISEFGLRPTIGLLRFLDEQLVEAGQQLSRQAAQCRQNQQGWQTKLGNAFAESAKRMKYSDDADRGIIEEGVKQAGGRAWWSAMILRYERSQAFIEEFRHQVLAQLIATLDQMATDLSASRRDGADRVDGWPGSAGVPPAFAPPPFEACLMPAESWPTMLDRLIENGGDSLERMRADIGGGGFRYAVGVQENIEHLALSIKSDAWRPRLLAGSGLPIDFEHHMTPDDVRSRAFTWINRAGSPLGDFVNQGLREYLADTVQGRPVADHRARLERFEVALTQTLNSAAPLVGIERRQLAAVHPGKAEDLLRLDSIPQRLPLSEGDPAWPVAARVIREFLGRDGSTPTDDDLSEFFTTVPERRESVTYVSRLASALHPTALSSVTEPILSSWNMISSPDAFWSRRRSRTLTEFVPVPPKVLDVMVRGFFNARILAAFPDPEQSTAATGFQILSKDERPLTFPWPLLAGRVPKDPAYQMAWLPWILESLPLALVQFSADHREAIAAYERLFELGSATTGSDFGLDDLPGELKDAILNGRKLHHPKVDLGLDLLAGPQGRKESCLRYLRSVSASFAEAHADEPDNELADIWNRQPGHELFGRIRTVLDRQLVPSVERYQPVGGPVL